MHLPFYVIRCMQKEFSFKRDMYRKYIDRNLKKLISSDMKKDEFAKSRAMRAIRASVVYVSTCPHANGPIKVPTCKTHANFSTGHVNVLRGVPFFQLHLPKGVPIFQLPFKKIIFFYITNKFIPNMFHIFCIF